LRRRLEVFFFFFLPSGGRCGEKVVKINDVNILLGEREKKKDTVAGTLYTS